MGVNMEDLAMYIIEILMNSIHASSNNIICNIERKKTYEDYTHRS